MNSTSTSTLEPLFYFLSYSIVTLEKTFNALPGSAVVARYVKSSHQNDPGRTVLEVALILFALVTLLQFRTRSDISGKHFIKFSEKEVDELVDEWVPEPLLCPLDEDEALELSSVPVIAGPSGPRPTLLDGQPVVNLASFNFTGLAGDEHIKKRAVETLRKYGLGSCGPPGFYGTVDVHLQLEKDIAAFLGTEAAIIYSQAFSTISSVIPAFCKRGDIIVADKAINFAIHKGIQISRSSVRYFAHNDMKNLEEVLKSVERERQKKRGKLTRRFIVTEGLFQNDGELTNLSKLIELKKKYKYRLILDESFSFGIIGKTGRGLTEHSNVSVSDVDMLVGSLANSFCSGGGFCAGSSVVVDHQRINGTSFVFSAAMPALLAVSASEGIATLMRNPSMITALQDNIHAARSILEKVDGIELTSNSLSPIIHIFVRDMPPAYLTAPLVPNGIGNGVGKHVPSDTLQQHARFQREEIALQRVVDETLSRGVMITRARRLKGQEFPEPRPSIRLAVTAALSRRDTENAVAIVKTALDKILSGGL